MADDPTQAIRKKASQYAGVDEGTACTQSSFKVGSKSFLFIGEQGGRHKAMFKLKDSISEATKLAIKHRDDYQVGNTAWVTARFSAEQPLPKKLWVKWLEESYKLSVGTSSPAKKKSAAKKPARRTPRKSK